MISKIKRSDFLAQYPDFPQADYYRDIYTFPQIIDRYILYANAKSAKGLAKNLATQTKLLIAGLGYERLLFLGDTKIPWLYQENDYKPVQHALDYLKANKVGKHFNGALDINIKQLSEFCRHLFWLVRCNASLPYIYFSDPGFNLMMSFCKYGNLHLCTLNELTDARFNEVLKETQFYISEDGQCYNQFSKTNRINHRRIVI